MERQERIAVLQRLLELRTSVAEAACDLSRLGYDSDDELVTLTPAHVVRVLDGYLSGEVDAGSFGTVCT
ncbi:hypothetical protein H4696_004991 [Amycolatopsis lexingtonensis]|uniref:Uncharacterized protein n=1 Tax=Amycolatopsis lexingtonensis TaxID=218822 RepID=A0ABR9I406_9PSEU|nr:hypothetical protein [Amycolatopsis lexingtonensis]MBE1497891.1 hypothetical protein [Amycolatopsis lexingtonensis]